MLRPLFLLLLLIISIDLQAQAPGNVTATFPLWLKANAGIAVASGAAVPTWTDQATALGGSNNATATGTAQPTYFNNTTNINFNPYIRFDGTTDRFSIATSTSINQVNALTRSNYTVFRTGASVTTPVRQLIYKERNHQSGFNIYLFNGSLYCSAFKTNGAPTWPWKGNSIAVSPNTTYVVSFVMNGTATNTGTIACYLNSAQFANLTGVGQIQSVNAISNIGARAGRTNYEGTQVATANTDYSIVDFAELAYYNSAHTNAERNRIESYLAVKYGITLNQAVANNYVNSASTVIFNATGTHNAYRNDIAGIMVDTNSALSQVQSKSVNTDAIVTMSTPSAMANGESLLWGNDNDDNGVIQEIYTGVPGTVFARTDRVWRVDQTGDVGTVTVQFNLNGIPVSGVAAADFKMLVDSADNNFTTGATLVNAASYAGGIVTFNNVDFTGDDFFTLVTLVSPTPPTVSISTNLSSIPENGGVATITATLSGVWTSAVTVNLGFTGTATNLTDYVRSGTSITIPSTSLTGTITLTGQDDAFSEGIETAIVDVTSVVNATENGVQQVTVNINDDEPVNNACEGQERLFTTELANGEVNTYSIAGVYQGTSTSAYPNNYEMVIDPDGLYRYLSSYSGQKITRSNLAGTGEIVLYDTAPNLPFQITINPNQGKIYWTEWSATSRIMCANLDGTGTPVAIATGLNYPTGMQIDKNTGNLFVYSGFNVPVTIARATTDGNCSPITLTNILATGLDLAYNLTIDPPGNFLFFVDYNTQVIKRVSTTGTGLTTLWTLTAPGDQIRDIVYNKNTSKLFWIHTNGVVQTANANGTGGITNVVSGGTAQPDSRSIDICVDDAPPRLTSFYSTTANDTYCPGSNIIIRAVYDEAVIAGSTLTAVLNNGASVLLNTISGNEISGTYTVGATGSGETIGDLSVASITAESVSDSNSNVRVNSTAPASPNNIADTSNIAIDTSAPSLTVITPVPNPTTNRNPSYVFSTDEAGSLFVSGSCDTVTTDLDLGTNTIVLDSDGSGGQLPDGTYSDCTITLTDQLGCNSAVYNINSFTVAGTVPTVTLSRTPASISEASGVSVVTATLSNTYALPVTVNLTHTGTASGSDYTLATSIVIPALSLSASINLTAVEDSLDEDDETVITDISSVTNGTESGVQQVTTTITDNDPLPNVTLSRSPASISEAGAISVITATLNTASGRNVTVNLAYTGTATNGVDYSAANSIVIPAGSLSANINLTAIDDLPFEATETVIIDISTVANGNEATPQTVTINITEDLVCNQPAWSAPQGYSQYVVMSFERTFAAGGLYTPPAGDDFDNYLGRDAGQKAAKRTRAVNFFLTNYGLDFSAGNSAQSGNVVMRYISFDPNFEAKVHAANGYRIHESGGELRAGIYQVIVLGGAVTLTGTWGGAGTYVPPGTVLEFGEYELNMIYGCTDSISENITSSTPVLVEFQSDKPSLSDLDQFNGVHYIDIPQIFEYDVTATSPSYTGGTILGRTEIRQNPSTNDVTAISSITLTVP